MASNVCKKIHCLREDNTHILFSSQPQLPDELLLEILIRLPRESACRFKVVCKDWCSLISSSYFNSRYINHTSKPFTIVVTLKYYRSPEWEYRIKPISNHPVLSKSLIEKPLTLRLQPLFKKYNARTPFGENIDISVEASCHDLVLLSSSKSNSRSYCVINLITGRRILLPRVPKLPNQPDHLQCTKPGLLCYHDQNNGDGCCRFKLMLIPPVNSYWKQLRESSSEYSIYLYCSETRQWSVVNVKWYPLKLNCLPYIGSYTPIVAHEGMLHWLNRRSVVSVDPFSDHMQHSLDRNIKLPKTLHVLVLFGVSGGQLRIASYTYIGKERNRVLQVWDLHNKKWFLVHKIVIHSSSLGQLPDQRLFFIAVHPYDTDVIFVMSIIKQMVYSFNMRTDILKEYYKLQHRKSDRRYLPVDEVPVMLH